MKIVLKLIKSDSELSFQLPKEPYLSKLKKLLNLCTEKTGGYVSLSLDRPYKPRTTGQDSQNNLVWKLITIIANEVGDDSEGMRDTERGVKLRAISKGYPYHVNRITKQPDPESMTKIDTVQCSALIETCYEIIAELGIILPPQFKESK